MGKNAFTLLELMMVLVLLGIVAFVALPYFKRDIRQEAAESILLSLVYTRHLAMVENKINPKALAWQKALWQIRFGKYGKVWSYTVGSNSDYNHNIDKAEAAIDPVNGKYMHYGHHSIPQENETPRIFLTTTYGIDNVSFNRCHGSSKSTARHIAFDHFGRPYRGVTRGGDNDFRALVTNRDCILTFEFIDKNIKSLEIVVSKETGYSRILE